MPATGTDIRKLGPADAFAFRRLMLEGCRETPADVGMYEDEWSAGNPLELLFNRFSEEWSRQDQFVLGAFDAGDTLVATLVLSRSPLKMYRHTVWISGVYVDPGWRKRGVARHLLDAVLTEVAVLDGVEQVMLKVRSTNHRARQLYRAAGFRSVGMEPRALKFQGEHLHLEWMVFPLSRDG
ncbi:MAG: GNAT family N-acetyltransferase [Firmicutes bacterium]|uniref:Ribosomal protein S18 acetylase RimI n=1 Tax=Melghirimyces thermohalophilus TaxID=1236220 RepID=A0A1G6I7D6_9BACL|nr:GNAT family N-acetyltransferase [Melghirimyces thermohalophilus]MDA8354012.1 GNAT family N-acetyltransferase [Bacillota bacterium]SDC02360.1 Ribosomal protein S18 acetylase RimI [Melghirimyces thermohalophilus]